MEMTSKTNSGINLGHAHFKIGDRITFRLIDGEKVEAIAVKKDANGNMSFIL